MPKIEGVGNTKEQANNQVNAKLQNIMARTNVTVISRREYGNHEIGFKVVVEYRNGI